MHPIRLFRRSVRALSLMLVLFGSGGCSSVYSACAAYACLNQTHLDGSLTIAEEVTLVDVQLCVDGVCQDGSIDLMAADAGTPCVRWDGVSEVCLERAAEPNTFQLRSAGRPDYQGAPHDTSIQIVITDQTSGRILLDETRSAKSHVTQRDDCHLCWTAEAAL
jgi:hypothetical protein